MASAITLFNLVVVIFGVSRHRFRRSLNKYFSFKTRIAEIPPTERSHKEQFFCTAALEYRYINIHCTNARFFLHPKNTINGLKMEGYCN